MRSVISVSLPKEMAAELEAFAEASGRNKSHIMKEALGLFLWENRFRLVKKRLAKKAKAAGIITEEDVFSRVS